MKNYLPLIILFCISLTGLAQETYTLSSDSKLTIDGTSTVHDWTVTANTVEGTLKAEGKGTAPKEIDFQVTVADIKSERGATMDKKMHNALGKDSHPKVMFTLKEVKDESTLVGTLTIGGNAQDVEIAGRLDISADKVMITGEHGIALKDFEIEPPTAMFGQVIVGNDVTVKFDLVFTK
ncbi:MAG: YceI family protein [Aurantibacter sp.]